MLQRFDSAGVGHYLFLGQGLKDYKTADGSPISTITEELQADSSYVLNVDWAEFLGAIGRQMMKPLDAWVKANDDKKIRVVMVNLGEMMEPGQTWEDYKKKTERRRKGRVNCSG